MTIDRRALLALGAVLPWTDTARATDPASAPLDLAPRWRGLFAGPIGETFAWWFQGVMFAHVDGLREFPVVGQHAVMICRTTAGADGGTILDFRTVGFYSDLGSGRPTERWDNVFTSMRQPIPAAFQDGRAGMR